MIEVIIEGSPKWTYSGNKATSAGFDKNWSTTIAWAMMALKNNNMASTILNKCWFNEKILIIISVVIKYMGIMIYWIWFTSQIGQLFSLFTMSDITNISIYSLVITRLYLLENIIYSQIC